MLLAFNIGYLVLEIFMVMLLIYSIYTFGKQLERLLSTIVCLKSAESFLELHHDLKAAVYNYMTAKGIFVMCDFA